MKKTVWKSISLGLIIIGIFLIIIQPFSMTGAVIDISTLVAKINFFVGLAFLGVGIFLMYFRTEERDQIKFKPLENILKEEGRDANTVFVLDTSGIIDYESEIEKLIEEFEGRVYIPKRIVKELEETKLSKRLSKKYFTKEKIQQLDVKKLKQEGYYGKLRKIRNEAREALGKTEKHVVYLRLRDIINHGGKPEYMHEDDFEDYKRELDNLDLALRTKYNKDPIKKNQLWLLKKHARVNKGDVDVLANALLLSRTGGKKAKIFARDSHLREAVDYLISKDKTLVGSLKYIKYSDKDFY